MFGLISQTLAALLAATADGGIVAMHGVSWTVADAIAYPCEEGVCVAMMDSRYDRVRFFEDGSVDNIDIHEHTPLAKRQLRLEIAEGGVPVRIAHDFDGTTVSSSEEALLASYVPRTSSHADGIAGAIFHSGSEGETIRIEFDLPIERGKR